MKSITLERNYDAFVQECRFFYCQEIYEGDWDGIERFIIASDTPEDELLKKYPEIMERLSPYLFCNAACGEVYAETKRNIDKFRKRRMNTISFGSSEDFEDLLPDDSLRDDSLSMEEKTILAEGLKVCTPIQRERIIKYFITGMNLREIANGNNISAIKESIDAGIKRIKRFYTDNP